MYMKQILELDSINKIAKEIIKEVKKSKKDNATIVAFYGDLGAGKTTITKEIAKELGVVNNIISPTFVIIKKYKTKDKIFKNLIHIDAYRLEKEKEILILGWEEIILESETLIIVEWPEKIAKYLPKDCFNIHLEHKDETTRTIKFWYN